MTRWPYFLMLFLLTSCGGNRSPTGSEMMAMRSFVREHATRTGFDITNTVLACYVENDRLIAGFLRPLPPEALGDYLTIGVDVNKWQDPENSLLNGR